MKTERWKHLMTLVFLIIVFIVILNSFQLTHEKKEESPMKDFYIENAEETGSENLVESILLDYRAFDTFGEVMVLYIAITGVIILGIEGKGGSEEESEEESEQESEEKMGGDTS